MEIIKLLDIVPFYEAAIKDAKEIPEYLFSEH